MADFDLAVIGGGIVGLSTAMQMTERFPGISVAVLEKEPALARHQALAQGFLRPARLRLLATGP